jgi:hypothetical protein
MKRLVLLIAAVAVVLALAVPVASAEGPPIAASGSFAEFFVPSNFRTADGVTFFDATGSESLSGTFSGTAVIEGSCVVRPAGQANCLARETFTGTVAGRAGTAVWLAVAQIDLATGSISGSFTVLSGTGELAGLHGEGTFQGSAGVGTYTGRFVFAP